MGELTLFLDKTVEQNAAYYYEKAKKAKHKKEGALVALDVTRKKIDTLLREKEKVLAQISVEEKKQERQRHREWYEKFHWFVSSEGFLCVGGRDATSNEVVVKKHAENGDLVFHTDMAGSPFFVVKNGQKAGEQTLREVAQATASYSRAWKRGLSTLEVFYVLPEQVSKKMNSGEYMPKGAFMIYGKTSYISASIGIVVGVSVEKRVIGGPLDAVKAHAEKYVTLIPGKEKTSDLAKKIMKTLGVDALDDIIGFVPAGGSEIQKEK